MRHAPIRSGSNEEVAPPLDVQAYAPSKPVAEMSDEEFSEWLCMLPPCPGIRSIDDDDSEEDARIEADIAAGRVYPHSLVGEWLKTAGSPEWKSFQEWLAIRDA